MVTVGRFGLAELRQLYLDEFFEYYEQTSYILEKKGVLSEGASESFKDEDTVDQLRNQILSN